ncbi:MAG: TonB-dependent receptor, partial [Sphingopyxis sp.]
LSQNPSQQNQWTQELRYARTADRWDFIAGLFGYHQRVRTQGTQRQGPAASQWLLAPGSALANDASVLDGLTAHNDIRLNNSSAAVFGQLTWHATDYLRVQPGLRINYDTKSGLYDSTVVNGAGQAVTFASTDPRIVAQRGVLSPQRFEPQFSDWNLSYDLSLSYDITADILVYATYARSFKSGGINLNGVPNDAAGNPIVAAGTVTPEKVDHYEIGLKTQFFNRRLTVNLTGFETRIADYQALVTNGQLGVLRGYLANADHVAVRGAELEFAARPFDRVNIYTNGAYTDARYTRFTDAPCPPELSGGATASAGQTPGAAGIPGALSPANCDISGQVLPGVSRWSASWGAEYRAPARLLATSGHWFIAYDGNARTRFSSNPTPSVYTWVGGYSLHNARAGFESDAGWGLFGWVRNAFDANYYEQLAVPSGNTGLIVGQPGDPRTWGATLTMRI